ncbi:MAG: fumarylacetoacetase [Saprospiraceae bacterium]|nr:fumarylacetoacetase [Candidatus Vicinibacter affinis]MBK7301891.1 fumarylacetoacetase [Candidatus Vicinibacter affinis]MBK8402767.1 fumarylacetoacetase [Candidatus Vicinibacter affinis]MBK8641041.1 fumarylacetoacetase [Candidatus Vicinibacter affinis]
MEKSIPASMKSWIPYDRECDFPIQNLPLGIFSIDGRQKKICSIIGDQIIDLSDIPEIATKCDVPQTIFYNDYLNPLLALGKTKVSSIRKELGILFSENSNKSKESLISALRPVSLAKLHLPIKAGDYTDFYSSREHATNVGIMFRDPANALLPNWLYLPVGYHGRASSIVVSGTPIKRPHGQIVIKDGEPPIFNASRQLDFELEMAFVIGKENSLGEPITIQKAEEHIQGLLLFNDWSARDIQKWEYVPLGPFLGKNFASSASPWLVDLEALEEFRVNGPEQDPSPLEYLRQSGANNFDIQLEVWLNNNLISKSNMKYLYWSIKQQLAHHTINGCNMQIGDICASGTISGPDPKSFGSMLELSWKGTKPIILNDGSSRTFLQNGDRVEMKAYAQSKDYRIGFGSCYGEILEE